MDAAHKLIKNIALFLALALLVAVPGRSQSQLSATPSPVGLSASAEFVQVTVGGSGTFSITNQVGTFFNVNPASTTAPTTVQVGLASTLCSNGGTTACNGSFTLHPTSATGGGTDVVVPVTFTPGGGGGSQNGVISATPSSVTLNTFTGSATSAAVSLTTTSATPIGFSISFVPTNSWLSVSANASQVSASQSVTLNVFANATNISSQQSGSITITPGNGGAQTVIPVTLNVNGSGGSTYSGTSPTSVSLAYPGGPTSQQIVIYNNAGVTTFNATVTNCSTNFLELTGGTASSTSQILNQPNSSNLTLTLNNAGSLATNTYTCQVVVSNPSNSADEVTITVTLAVNGGGTSTTYNVSATSVALAYPGTPQSQAITISSNNSAVTTFNATVTNCISTNFLILISGSSASASQLVNQPLTNSPQLNLTLDNPGAISTGSYSCQVVVSNPSNSSNEVTIGVTLAVNGGGSTGGGFAFSQSSYSFTSAVGSTNTQSSGNSVTLVSSIQSTYNATFTPGSTLPCSGCTNWISIDNGGSSVSNYPVTSGFSIALNNPQSFNAGSYTGTVTVSNPSASGNATLTIFLTVNSGGSTGTSYSLNVNSATLQYPFGQQSANIYVSSSTQTQFIATTSVSGGVANWLLVTQNGQSGTQIRGSNFTASSNPLTLYLNQNAVPQAAGTYIGQVTIANPSNSADFALVTVTLIQGSSSGGGGFSVSPTSLSFSTPVGVVPATQSISVTAPSSSSTFTASLQAASGSIFVVSPCNGCSYTGSQNLVVSVSPGSLGAGTYTDYITLASGGTTFSFITVTLVVGGSGTTSSIAAPTSLSFYYEAGQSSPPAQTITIAPSGTFTASTNQSNWLALSTTSGNGPGNLLVSVIPQGFTAGSTNTGTITINTSSGTQSVNVSLTVTSGMVLYANPGTINLITPNYQSQLQISASDNSSQQVTASTQTPWLSLTSPTNNGNTPASYLVTVTPTGLCNGLNTGSITASTGSAANSPLSIPVTVLISGSSATSCTSSSGPLTLSTSSLTFTGAQNGGTPPTQILAVTTPSTSTFFTVSTSVQTGNWLSILSCTSCTGSQNLVVSVNQSGLNAGTYQGTIYLYTNGTVQQVGVTLTVGTSGTSGNISLSTNSLSFTAQVNGSTPAAQTVQVSSSTSGVGYTYQVATSSGGSWLSASVNGTTLTNGQGLTTPTTLTVNVNSSNLGAGSYTGTITLSPNGGSTVTISVSLSVQNNVVSASPSSLTFTYTAGSTAPSPQPVTVSSGTAGLAFGAQVSAGNCASGWLAASPATGTTQASVSVSVNPAGLNAGTCNGTVTIAGTSGASGSTTVSVTLTVTVPVITITQVGSAASYLGTSISPGEIITIFGTGLGPTPFVTLALDSTGKVATTLGGVQVLIAGFPCPMVFASNTQVSAVVPYEVAQLHGSQPVVVKFLGQTSNAIGIQLAATAPGIFTANASGTGPGAISNQNYSANSPSNPAAKGSTVAIYMTGEGLTSPALADGSVTAATLPPPQVTPAPLLPVAVLIDGQPASIAYAGEAPGIVAGVMQVNVVIPAGARTGDLPLVVSVGGTSSQSGVTVSVH